VAACLQLISYIYSCIICAEINGSYYSHGSGYRYNLRLYAHVMPVCSIDAPAVGGVVLELWPSVWDRDACIQSYWVLWSYVCCSVINDSLR